MTSVIAVLFPSSGKMLAWTASMERQNPAGTFARTISHGAGLRLMRRLSEKQKNNFQLSESIPSEQSRQDEHYMRLALCLARLGLGRTSPNPAVGAVIVSNGNILSTGWHKTAGCPHAEAEALGALPPGQSLEGATLYVTLEPCSTHGRTPPCTEAILAAKLARVVIGSIDPNPRHQGKGIETLRHAGIEVTTAILE